MSEATQISIVCLRIIGRLGSDDLLFQASEFCSQLFGDGFGYIALN